MTPIAEDSPPLRPRFRLTAEHTPWLILLAGLCALYIPTFYGLLNGIWASEAQAHGPIVLAVSIWLLWKQWPQILRPNAAPLSTQNSELSTEPQATSLSTQHSALSTTPKAAVAWPILIISALLYALGRSQDILIFEVGSLIGMLIGCVLLLRGPAQLKLMWFGLFFMLFMIPLPGAIVDALTQPMKIAVSWVTEWALYHAGYPIARTGVILQIGQYQLLVADACAGLQTLFTLESMGLLYLNLVRHSSLFRNVTLAILIIPISFFANVIRVITLTLVTYYFGDEAGQGFVHSFAGMVLFISALLLIIGTDTLLRLISGGKASTQETQA
ncbi:exosortase [Uliginosibacterium flavum]|uniref:Exosortase B n=1 Tax=Uliginosibacterium flavum TaxID=1396831 RepID=A0ABV2TQT8_9RHOO